MTRSTRGARSSPTRPSARERALRAFSPSDAAQFATLLERSVDPFDEKTRAPIRPEADDKIRRADKLERQR